VSTVLPSTRPELLTVQPLGVSLAEKAENYSLEYFFLLFILAGIMRWLLGAGAGGLLVAFGFVLRRLLRLDGASLQLLSGWVRLTAGRESIYRSIAVEIETQVSIVGVSLNDAIEQSGLGKQEMAWRLVDLADCEWDQLAQIVIGLLNALLKHMPLARVLVPVRSVAAQHFKSPGMADYARMHEAFEQFVFRYKLRFNLHIKLLRHAAETLTAEFGRAYRCGLRAEDGGDGIWTCLDLCFHDFDLITKEALLAFRAFLACMPDKELPDFATDLNALVAPRMRATA